MVLPLFTPLRLDGAHAGVYMSLLETKYGTESDKILESLKGSHKAMASCTKALQNVYPIMILLM